MLEATIDKKDFVAKPNESIFGGVKENGISSGSDQGGGAHGKVTLQNIETLFTKMVPYFVLDRKSKSSSSYAHSDSISNASKHNKSVSKDVVKEESVIWSTQADKLAFANFIWQTLNPQEVGDSPYNFYYDVTLCFLPLISILIYLISLYIPFLYSRAIS